MLADVTDEAARLNHLFYYLAPEAQSEDRDALLSKVRLNVPSMAAQLWWRFVFPCSQSWDVRLLRIFGAKCSAPESEKLAAEFWDERPCCLSPSFAGKDRRSHGSRIRARCGNAW